MGERYHNIDLMKNIGIFLVILYHFRTIEIDFITNQSLIVFVNYTFRSIYSMCVPLFFFANGFVLIRKELNLKKHVTRMLQMVVLTIIWGIIDLALILVIENKSLSLYEFVAELWTRDHGWLNHLWFMGALICIQIFFPLIKNAFDNNRRIFIYFITICFVLVFGNEIISIVLRLCYYFFLGGTAYGIKNVFNIFNPISEMNAYAFGYFCMGCLFGGYKEKIDDYIRNRFNCLLLITIIIVDTVLLSIWGMFCSYIGGKIWDNIWYGYNLIFTLINVMAVYALSVDYGKNKKKSNYIEIVSRNTLGIFFIHVIVNRVLGRLGVKDLIIVHNIFSNIFVAFIILNISLTISIVIRKMPILKYLLI